MQTKNLIVFLFVAALIMAGWFYVQNQVLPPLPQRPKEEAKKPPVPHANEIPAVGLAAAWLEPEAPHARDVPVAGLAAAWLELKKEPVKPVEVIRTLPGDKIVLGGDRNSPYHYKAVLTRLGGGVDSLILNKFKEAGPYGKGTDKPLELIPPDAENPSFLLYDYQESKFSKIEDRHPADRLGRVKWEVVKEDLKAEVQKVVFRAEVPGFIVRKTYELAPYTYHLGLTIEVERTGNDTGIENRPFRYQLTGPHGLPIEGKWYTSVFRNALIGLIDKKQNLARTLEDSRSISHMGGGNRVPENQLGGDRIQYAMIATQYFASGIVVDNSASPEKNFPPEILDWVRPTLETVDDKVQIIDIDKAGRRLFVQDTKGETFWVRLAPRCQIDITSETDTLQDLKEKQVVYVRYRAFPGSPRVATEVRAGSKPPQPQFDDISVAVNSAPLEPGKAHKYLLYSGPVKVRLLDQFSGNEKLAPGLVERYENDLHLNTLTDYHSDSWIGRFSNSIHWTGLLIFFTNLMHGLLGLLHSILPVYGLNIILLTVMVRGLMFPISRKQAYISMKMQSLAPEMKKIQEKYKTDPQERTKATMDLYRRHGVNPLGGCLPLVLQLPIFLGLYYALQESIFFRLAGFLWIDNLAAPDMLFWWGESIPIVSGFLGPFFNLLPVVAVLFMVAQQKMMTPPPQDENQAFQQKLMKYMMIFFGVMFYKVAAGLCIYFIASSLWGLAERKLLPKRGPLTAAPAATPAPGKPTRPAPGRGSKGKKPVPNDDGAIQKVKAWWADVLKQAKKK